MQILFIIFTSMQSLSQFFRILLNTLKSALADISAATNTRKQSTVTFEVFVLWLRNQCYYTRDVLGIKMTYRSLPNYKGISPKHAVNIKKSTKITQTV